MAEFGLQPEARPWTLAERARPVEETDSRATRESGRCILDYQKSRTRLGTTVSFVYSPSKIRRSEV